MFKIAVLLFFVTNIFSCSSSETPSPDLKSQLTIYKGDPVGKLSKIEVNGRYGYQDEKGNIIVKPVYNQLPEQPWEFMNVKIGAETGLINYLGDTLIEFGKYQQLKIEHSLPLKRIVPNPHGVQYFSDKADCNMICKKEDKYGMISTSEAILIPIEFDKFKYIFDNKYAFSKNGKWLVVDSKGQSVSDVAYDEVTQIFKYSYFIYEMDNREGAFNIKTKKDAIGLHEKIIAIGKGALAAKDNGKFRVYNLTGERLSDLALDTVYFDHGNNAPVPKSILTKYNNPKVSVWAAINDRPYMINEEGRITELK